VRENDIVETKMCKERRLISQHRNGKLGTRSEETVTRHSRKCDVANCLFPVPKPHCPYFPLYVLFQCLYSNKENQGNFSEERRPVGRESNPGLSWTNQKWSPKERETDNWYFARSPYITHSTEPRVSSQPSWSARHLAEYQVVTIGINSVTYCFTNILRYYSWTAVDRDSTFGIATRYGLDGPGIESSWRRDFPHPSRPALWLTQYPLQ
jgi:hypothetical protein